MLLLRFCGLKLVNCCTPTSNSCVGEVIDNELFAEPVTPVPAAAATQQEAAGQCYVISLFTSVSRHHYTGWAKNPDCF